MRFLFPVVCLAFLQFSCNNYERPKVPLDGGGCSYQTKDYIYQIDSFELENDSISVVHFVSKEIIEGEVIRTTLNYETVIIDLHYSSQSIDLDSLKMAKSKFHIIERFIQTGACSPYSLDKIEIVEN